MKYTISTTITIKGDYRNRIARILIAEEIPSDAEIYSAYDIKDNETIIVARYHSVVCD